MEKEISNQNQPEDLLKRTKRYAKNVRHLVKNIPKTIESIEDGRQSIRSSGSVAANYIESREAISKKDAIHRLRICRKEACETKLWLELFDLDLDQKLESLRKSLIRESDELTWIFSTIIKKLTF